MEEQIKSILAEMQKIFRGAVGPHNRQDYMEYIDVSGNDWHFGLSADYIIKNKIPKPVIGCTGCAKLFCHLAAERGIKSFVVCCAEYDSWASVRQNKNNHHINGHQIVAVKINGKLCVFDPGHKDLVFIDTKLQQGEFIDALRDGKKDFIVTAVVPDNEFARIDRYRKLHNLYVSGDVNNSEFTIKPSKLGLFNRGKTRVIDGFMNMIYRIKSPRENA